ncbi:TPM domain-containing protein [Winogradskyella sp. SYSU M77433]|uniref:TPM domain-containing protein n=1 Tax=Winogradskyella sp. SYSU M77433 TaxID=3042722 RepID=UPI0024808890|nr:TPM domain-containing protein [Winogradskyella sp. SYSU M77433]MDH7913262.1 TPM domain-containing protein [Winogradskyella sp. SYSU M77433]
MNIRIYFSILFTIALLTGCKYETKKSKNTSDYIPKNYNEAVVFDSSNLFSPLESDSLIQKIITYEKETTNEIAILTVDSIPKNMDIKFFGTNVAKNWGIGKKEKDNGLLITISKFDRQVAISTGLGTEKTISDYECKVIIDSIMIPNFVQKKYYKGVSRAIDSISILWD